MSGIVARSEDGEVVELFLNDISLFQYYVEDVFPEIWNMFTFLGEVDGSLFFEMATRTRWTPDDIMPTKPFTGW